MIKIKLFKTALIILIFFLSCSSDEYPDVFRSNDAFVEAANKVGTGEGNPHTGTYTVTFKNVGFSDDCTPSFVRENDFYVSTSASDEELDEYLNQKVDDYSATITITQNNGTIVFDCDGDDIEYFINGWIDEDGTFQAVTGTYADENNLNGAVYNGTIVSGKLEAEFVAKIKYLDNVDISGSCTFSADIE